MIILVLGCFFVAHGLPGDSCQTTTIGIFAKRQTEFEEQLNRLRNEVAQGRRKNHVGEMDIAVNMNVVEWQQGIGNVAQTCSERCPDSLESCKQLITRYSALHKFRTVHSISQEWEPREVYQKWMDDNKGEQLVIARMKYFGCGRALKKNIDKFIEYVVCFFDEAPRKGVVPYVSATQKTIGSACDKGRSITYSGLCKMTIYQQKYLMEQGLANILWLKVNDIYKQYQIKNEDTQTQMLSILNILQFEEYVIGMVCIQNNQSYLSILGIRSIKFKLKAILNLKRIIFDRFNQIFQLKS